MPHLEGLPEPEAKTASPVDGLTPSQIPAADLTYELFAAENTFSAYSQVVSTVCTLQRRNTGTKRLHLFQRLPHQL